MDRLPLVISTLCFLFGFAATAAALKAGRFRPRRFNLGIMSAGFLFQTFFLLQRGRTIGHCPVTNLFEVLIFLSWSITLFYFLTGPAYRLSLVGVFTEPLVFGIQAVALLAPLDPLPRELAAHSPWVEFHAALSVMAYGAFAMAAIAGIMYLVQERQLKTHRFGAFFFQMPPIAKLATANLRLLWVGLAILSAGFVSAVAIRLPVPPRVMIWGGAMWGAYLSIVLGRRLGPRRAAVLSVAVFLLSAAALCGLNHFSLRTL